MSRDSERLRELSKRLEESGRHHWWHERHGDAIEVVTSLDVLKAAAARLARYEQVSPQEERVAWDRFVSGAIAAEGIDNTDTAAEFADSLLEKRRARFGSSEPEPSK